VINNGLDFQRVPWSPPLETQLGRHVAGVAKGGAGIDALFGLFIPRGDPVHVRSDNGRSSWSRPCWIGLDAVVRARTPCIAQSNPWESSPIASFNAWLRNKLIDGEIFSSLAEARIVIESWRFTTMQRGHTPCWAKGRQLRKSSCPDSGQLGRPRNAGQFRRPSWPRGRSYTSSPDGPDRLER
jgi:hypothetical protein